MKDRCGGGDEIKLVFLMSWGRFMNTRSPLAKSDGREVRLLICNVTLMYSLEANRGLLFHIM